MKSLFGVFISVALITTLPIAGEWLWRQSSLKKRLLTVQHPQRTRYLDREIGLRLLPNLNNVRETFELDGVPQWSTLFSTDEKGRRTVPNQSALPRKMFAVFFGDSFVFGEGLQDNQTLPFHFSRLQPGWTAYNYGDVNYGPHQMLARLRDVQIKNEIPEERGVGIYVFTGDQVRRAAGSMRSLQEAPRFELDNAFLTRKGFLRDGHPATNFLFGIFETFQLYNRFGPDWPLRISDSDYDLTCALINSASQAFQKLFKRSHFVVMIRKDYPRWDAPKDPKQFLDIRPCLDQLNMIYFDYYDRLGDQGRFMLPDGNHPSDFGNQYGASLLSQDLAPLIPPI